MAAPVVTGALALAFQKYPYSVAGGDEAAPVRESVSAGRAAWQKMLGNDSCRPSGERLKRSGRLKKIECCKTERKGRGGDVTGG